MELNEESGKWEHQLFNGTNIRISKELESIIDINIIEELPTIKDMGLDVASPDENSGPPMDPLIEITINQEYGRGIRKK